MRARRQEGPGLGLDGLGEGKLGVGDLQTQGWRRTGLGEKQWAQMGLGEVKGWGAHLRVVCGGYCECRCLLEAAQLRD